MRVVLISSVASLFIVLIMGPVASFAIPRIISGSIGGLDPTSDTFDPDSVRETANNLSGMYVSIIDDITSFQTDPDYERAEQKRQEWVLRGETLASFFRDLADEQQRRLDGLQAEAEDMQQSSGN